MLPVARGAVASSPAVRLFLGVGSVARHRSAPQAPGASQMFKPRRRLYASDAMESGITQAGGHQKFTPTLALRE